MLPQYTPSWYSGRNRSPNCVEGSSSTSEVRGISRRVVSLPERGIVDLMPGIEARLAMEALLILFVEVKSRFIQARQPRRSDRN